MNRVVLPSLLALIVVSAPMVVVAQETTPETPTKKTTSKQATTEPTEAKPATATKADGPKAEAPKPKVKKATSQASPKKPTLAPIPLDVMLKEAYRRAPGVQAAKAQQAYAKWQQYRANRAWFPSLTSNTFLSLVPDNTDPNRFNENIDELLSFNVGPFVRQNLRLAIPIYTFDRITVAQDLADLGVENAKIGVRKTKVDLAFDIKRAYYAMGLALAFEALIKDGGKLFEKELQKMKDARDFGDADFKIKDYRKLQIFETDFAARALDNKKLKTMSLAGIHYLTGKKYPGERFAPLDDSSKVPKIRDLALYERVATKHRPEVAQLKKAIRARKLQVEMKKSDFYPNIFFALDFTFGWSTETVARQPVCRIPAGSTECVPTDDLFARAWSNPFAQRSFGALIGINWNFNYPQLYGKYKEAEAQLIKTQHQQQQALGAIGLEIKKLHLDASQGYEKVQIYARRLKAAERWRNQVGFGAQQGGAAGDALEAVKAYYQAKILYLQSVYDYRIARAALAKGIGVTSLDQAEGTARGKTTKKVAPKKK